jgi:hypothetical protein
MTGENNGHPYLFKLDMSKTVAQEIKKVIQQAYLEGVGDEALRALKRVFDRVRIDPLQVGELFRYHEHLNLLVHVTVIHPIAVYFAIHPVNKFVVIQKVLLISSGSEE